MQDTIRKIRLKLNRVKSNPTSWRSELQFLKRWSTLERLISDGAVEFEENWDAKADQPIIFIWNIQPWKRPFIPAYLPQYRVAFVLGRRSIKSLQKRLGNLIDPENIAFGIWGNSAPHSLKQYAETNGIDLFHIEDGFLRSMGSGVKHTRPHSLVFDRGGLYYDYGSESEVQDAINNIDFSSDKKLKAQAKAGLVIFQAANLTKYYNYFDNQMDFPNIETNSPTTLVIGQVEGDASIKYGQDRTQGMAVVFKNLHLVQSAAQRCPDDYLVYKPHPDIGNLEIEEINRSVLPRELGTVDSQQPMSLAVKWADRIYTQTSLTGLEATFHNKPVTVRGRPFYAGHGLTVDIEELDENRKSVSVEEMFAAAYLKYPRYIHPVSDELCSYFDVAGHFIVEQVKYLDVRKIPDGWLDLDALRSVEEFLPAPTRLLLYLNACENFSDVDADVVLSLVDQQNILLDFPQFSELLIGSYSFDILKEYVDRVIARLFELDKEFSNRFLFENLFDGFVNVQANLNGRVCSTVPEWSEKIVAKLRSNPKWHKAVISYARILSNGLQYEELDRLLRHLQNSDLDNPATFQQICSVLRASPTRSERRHAYRRALLVRSSREFGKVLSIKYPSYYDNFLNSALVALALDDDKTAIDAWQTHLRMFGQKASKNDGTTTTDAKKGQPEKPNKNRFSFSHPKFEQWGSLSRRIMHVMQLYEFFIRKGHYEIARTMLEQHFYSGSSITPEQKATMDQSKIAYHAARAEHEDVISVFSGANHIVQREPRTLMRYSKSLRSLGEFEQSKKLLMQRASEVLMPTKRLALNAEIEKINFCIETSQFLNSYPQPRIPKGVVFLASQGCYNTLAMMAPALYSLKKRGYVVVNLMEGMGTADPCGVESIDQFAGTIPTTLHRNRLEHPWTIDWDDKKVEALGINFYQGFYERLSTFMRRYDVDLNEDEVQRNFRAHLHRSDVCLKTANKIYQEVVKSGVNVVLACGNSHVTPFSVFRDFARAKDHPKLSFINCNVAYESYFSNLGSKYASTMCVTDMTLHKDRRAPFMALPDRFEKWYQENRSDKELRKKADAMIRVNRNSSADDSVATEIIKWLKKERKAGKKVVCALGKVPVDLNVPYDGGPAHSDMKDWLNHTIAVATDAPGLIVLIKPHPHELKPEIALDLVDGFSDLIDVPIPENVRILGHRDINVHALAPHLDLAILWNGSSSLELTAMGNAVMMTSHFGKHDYPIDMIYPKSREHYGEYLKKGVFKTPAKETRQRAAYLISYLGSPDVSILNEYSLRQITNDKVGLPKWRWDKLKNLMEEGDPLMDEIANRMVEKFSLQAST